MIPEYEFLDFYYWMRKITNSKTITELGCPPCPPPIYNTGFWIFERETKESVKNRENYKTILEAWKDKLATFI